MLRTSRERERDEREREKKEDRTFNQADLIPQMSVCLTAGVGVRRTQKSFRSYSSRSFSNGYGAWIHSPPLFHDPLA